MLAMPTALCSIRKVQQVSVDERPGDTSDIRYRRRIARCEQ
jgi:hypothetical protein